MSPYSQLTEALADLISFPFVVAGGLWRLWQRWRAVPLHLKNQVRAGAGAAGLALCASCWSWLLTLPHGTMILAGALSLLAALSDRRRASGRAARVSIVFQRFGLP